MYLSFPIQVKGKEDKMHTSAKGIWRDERHTVRNNGSFYQEWPSFSLSKSVLLLYALNSCHPDTIITPISHWKTGHFTSSFSLHLCNQQLKKRKKQRGPKSCLAIFLAARFLFSTFTQSFSWSFLKLMKIITYFCHKYTGLSRESNGKRERNHLIY